MATFTYGDTADQNTLIERIEYRADQVVATGQTVPINRESVYSELVDSMRAILRKAPAPFVLPAAKDGSADANTNGSDQTSHFLIPMPDDFIRFLRVKLLAWNVAVDDLLSPHSNAYRLQANQYASADPYHPLAVLVPNFSGSGNQALECYPTDPQADPVELYAYVAEVAPENMPDELVDSMLWDATGRVLQNERDFNAASAAFEASVRSLSDLRIGAKGEELPVSQDT